MWTSELVWWTLSLLKLSRCCLLAHVQICSSNHSVSVVDTHSNENKPMTLTIAMSHCFWVSTKRMSLTSNTGIKLIKFECSPWENRDPMDCDKQKLSMMQRQCCSQPICPAFGRWLELSGCWTHARLIELATACFVYQGCELCGTTMRAWPKHVLMLCCQGSLANIAALATIDRGGKLWLRARWCHN